MISSDKELWAAMQPVFHSLPENACDAVTVIGAILSGILNSIEDDAMREHATAVFVENLLNMVRRNAGRLH